MWWDRERPWTVVVPPLVAGGLVFLFFWLTDRWAELENPVASQVTLVAGLLGFLAGVAAQRITRWELVAVPAALAAGVVLWAYYAPGDTPADRDFRQILWVLAAILIISTVVLNVPQIVRGRHARPSALET